MNHSFVTIAVPFATERAETVRRILDQLGNPAGPASRDVLDLAGTIHFMSLSVVADTAPGLAHLFLELSADGGPDDALRAVCGALGGTIDRALVAAGVNDVADPTDAFLRRYRLDIGSGGGGRKAAGFAFNGAPRFSVWRIRNEARLADHIADTMLDILQADMPAILKVERVGERLWVQNEKWAFAAEPALFLDSYGSVTVANRIKGALIAAFWMTWWLWSLAILSWYFLGFWPTVGMTFLTVAIGITLIVRHLRQLEKTDPVDDSPPDAGQVEAILAHENVGAQNLLAAMSVMKPGWFRRRVLKLAFAIAAQDAHTIFRVGFLREIGVIHFARWALIPGTDRLMFWSNFSDGWESYLEDFIMKAGDGLTAIWSNTRGFPKTSFLIRGGAADGDRFRRWARRQQYAVSFWYSAYPEIRMTRIRRNAAIREGLSGAVTRAEAENWVAMFGSEPRPSFMLQKQEIPTLVLGGLRRLRFASALVLQLPPDPAAARQWLRGVQAMATFGEAGRADQAGAFAFTAHGLTRFGVAAEDLATFPPAFQSGMTSAGRAQALGDIGAQAPGSWVWGKAEETDAIVVLYETDKPRLAEAVRRLVQGLERAGGSIRLMQPLQDLPAEHSAQIHEPFGFADGLSQPILRDSPRARIGSNINHVIDAGEFVFGYPDNQGYFPPSPTVLARNDPHRRLPEVGPDSLGVAASFHGGGSDGYRDVGRNGTFLVVRQFEQNVALFDAYTQQQAERLSTSPGGPFTGRESNALKQLLQAKILGRWPDGRSLVRHAFPDDGHAFDNDFCFQREDPQGLACPFGAHIRRANPRDSIDTTSSRQFLLSNRHRILRVGRPFEADEGGLPGLLFMCVNADIERQFEFIQRTWILGSAFHHLGKERDPLIAPNGGTGEFTIPTLQGPVRLEAIPSFVKVLGGGYFFMPGRRSLNYLADGP